MVAAGRLPADGGGHGIALRFKCADLDRITLRRWRPFVSDVPRWEIFARYAGTVLLADDELARSQIEYQALARIGEKAVDCYAAWMKYVSSILVRHDARVKASRALWGDGDVKKWVSELIPLESVRPDLIECARNLDGVLTRGDWDFLLASKIVRHAPTWKTIKRAERLEGRLRGGSSKLFLGHKEMMSAEKRAEFGGVGFLCDNAVADVLGVHRFPAARMRKRLFARLGDDVFWLIVALQVPVGLETMSRQWLRSLHSADATTILDLQEDKPIKKTVLSPVPESAEDCPKCGKGLRRDCGNYTCAACAWSGDAHNLEDARTISGLFDDVRAVID